MTVQLPVGATQLVKQIKKTKLTLVLALCSAFFVAPAFALEPASDADMSDASGEGLAFFAQGIELQMPSVAGNFNGSVAQGSFGAGAAGTAGGYGSYIYLSPIGPATGGNKTDVYLYGLSISQNDNLTANPTGGSVVVPTSGLVTGGATAHNTLFSGTGINWGTALDPFSLQVLTTNQPTNLPNAVGLDGTPITGGLPYLQIAAPKNVTSTVGDPAYSANNIRLGLWANIMQYDGVNAMSGNALTTGSGPNGIAGPALPIQAIWDGFGINGTEINLYPTDNCSSCTSGSLTGNSDYAKTLGFSGKLRFNSQKNGVLRLSVAGTSSGGIGNFDPYEGIYIQNPDINLVLGNLNYQPLILASNGSGQVSLELARIPNVAAAYNQFYINYDCTGVGPTCTTTTGVGGASATGLTPYAGNCSSANCSATATHSSITMGDIYVNNTSSNVTLTGTYTPFATASNPSPTPVTVNSTVYPGGSDAMFTSAGSGSANIAGTAVNGVTFKAPGATGAAVNLGTAAISGLMINHMKMTLTGL
ncbi:hypothetical protein [Aquirhabdus sp.]|uniref:hypothetical protein n=1 Tax=Aquirhabdus sp. TaxID=2824160 RepID=UPI00396CDB5E